jgi:NADH-quinone oxidoreductase subunit L
VVTAPLVLLAIPSVVIGYLTIQPLLFGDFFKDAIFVDAERHGAMKELSAQFHGAAAMAVHGLQTLPFWLALAGVVVAWWFYLKQPSIPAAIGRALSPVVRVLENKYYMDWFNENVLAKGARGLGLSLWKVGDRAIIDGFFVNGSWKVVGWVSGVVRWFQSGFLYHYALVMILGVFVLMTYFVWLA